MTVVLFGFSPLASAVKVVRSEFSCDDIGGLATSQQPEFSCDDIGGLVYVPTTSTSSLSSGTMSATISFIMPLKAKGDYRICVVTDSLAYGPAGATWRVTSEEPSVDITPCGGVLTSTTIVSINSANGTMVSVNRGSWQTTPQLSISSGTSTIVSGLNNYEQRTCSFRPLAGDPLPSNATYGMSLDAAGSVLFEVTAGNIAAVSKAQISVYEQNCTGSRVWSSLVVITGSSVIPDDVLPSSLVSNMSVVCLDNSGIWGMEISPSRIRLSPLALRTFACSNCSSGLCLTPNATCACVTPGTLAVYSCPASDTTDSGTSLLTVVRVLLLIVYVCVLVIIWVVMHQGAKPSSRDHHERDM
eukprot:CAMPEP_0176476208 /NCGR_PEP_ID=MMETSP0127-20121128/44020_1 /TAXON_ID=938130 /ORGANISM="Platyophrya macrostoma, Strain WH" /LENGTH=356 /DNA_ID=CAMNT_0017871861 /DNA_START=71 /DNA_END=1142 /DNA_ORIENTATION=+